MYGYTLDILRVLALPLAVIYAARFVSAPARVRRARRRYYRDSRDRAIVAARRADFYNVPAPGSAGIVSLLDRIGAYGARETGTADAALLLALAWIVPVMYAVARIGGVV